MNSKFLRSATAESVLGVWAWFLFVQQKCSIGYNTWGIPRTQVLPFRTGQCGQYQISLYFNQISWSQYCDNIVRIIIHTFTKYRQWDFWWIIISNVNIVTKLGKANTRRGKTVWYVQRIYVSDCNRACKKHGQPILVPHHNLRISRI